MSLRVAEVPSGVLELHDEASADGDALSAHVLRRLSGNAMRLVCRPERVINETWDSSAQGMDSEGALIGWGAPVWAPITPWYPGAKRPGVSALDMRLTVKVPAGELVWFGIETRDQPWSEGAVDGDPLVVSATGTGDWQTLELDGIPCRRGVGESLRLWARGVPNATDGTLGGSPSNGTIDRTYPDGIADLSATWTTDQGGNSWAETGHWLRIEDASGREIVDGRWIVAVPAADTLVTWPDFIPQERLAIRDQTYRIRTLPSWQVCNLAVYTALRSG